MYTILLCRNVWVWVYMLMDGALRQRQQRTSNRRRPTPIIYSTPPHGTQSTPKNKFQNKQEFPGKSFDRFYVSEYIRCMETAARLNIPYARYGFSVSMCIVYTFVCIHITIPPPAWAPTTITPPLHTDDQPDMLRWFAEVFLRERDWGQMDLMSWAERQASA